MFDIHSSGMATVSGSSPNIIAGVSSRQIQATIEQLRLVRQFIYEQLRDGADYGSVAGFGDQPTLLQPGAQKICMFFDVYPDYEVDRRDVGDKHVDYVVKTTLISRATGLKVGSGVGSCSSLEKKYRYRNQNRSCPRCRAETIRSSRAGGFFCGVRAGGCGASFGANDPAILNQRIGQVENADVADAFNTVLKISKKRSFVDAVLSLSCISEFFTQDLEDRGAPLPVRRPLGQNADEGRSAEKPSSRVVAGPPPFSPDSALNWLEHPHVAEYNRVFEQMVDLSGTRNSDREPACRTFIKNEWMKIAWQNNVEARPDRVPADLFVSSIAEWGHVVNAAITEKRTTKQARRNSRQLLTRAA
ncbi:MAG: hypothetical protein ACR2IE_10075 [Candidatus Sumerlaeaceae bacterium]